MNRKILLTTLITVCSAPETNTANHTSFYLYMSPIMLNVKQFIGNANDVSAIERATHNAHNLARQELVFDFIDALSKYYEKYAPTYELKRNLEEKAEKVNREFQMDSTGIIYYQLMEAVKRKIKDIKDLIYKMSLMDQTNYLLRKIYKLTPTILLATVDIGNSNQNKTGEPFLHIQYLIPIVELIIKLREQPKLQAKASEIANIALKKASAQMRPKMCAYFINIAKAARKLGNVKLEDKSWREAFTCPRSYYEYIDIVEAAYQIEDRRLAKLAFQHALNWAADDIDHNEIVALVREIKSKALKNKALEQKFLEVNNYSDYLRIAKEAQELENNELAYKAIDKALALIEDSFDSDW